MNSEEFPKKDTSESEQQGIVDDEFAASVQASRSLVESIDTQLDQRTAEIAVQDQSLSEETARKIGEEGLEDAGVEEPAASGLSALEKLMSGTSETPIQYTAESAAARVEKEDAERLVPTRELAQVEATISEILHQYTFKYVNPTDNAEIFETYTMAHNIFDESTSVLRRLENGQLGKEAASIELGALIALVKDPKAGDEIVKQIHASQLFSDTDVYAFEARIASVFRKASEQGVEGEHFRSVLTDFDKAASAALREDGSLGSAELAVVGASIGVYARIGEEPAIRSGMKRLSGLCVDIHTLKKQS